ncbi:MAG: hypothetical protein RLZZ127_1510, partial [Planctomycetota bacterium]
MELRWRHVGSNMAPMDAHPAICDLAAELPHPTRTTLLRCRSDLAPDHPWRLLAETGLAETDDGRERYGARALAEVTDVRAQAWLLGLLLAATQRTPDDRRAHRLGRLEALVARIGHPRFLLLPLRLRLHQALADGNADRHRAILGEAERLLALGLDPDGADELAYHRLLGHEMREDWSALAASLAELRARPDVERRLGIDLRWHEIRLLEQQAPLGRVLDALDRCPPGHRSQIRGIGLLAWNGRLAEARARRDAWAAYPQEPGDLLFTAWDLFLAEGRIDEALACCRSGDGTGQEGLERFPWLRAETALLRRAPGEAAAALAVMDSHAHPALRVRLALLRGDLAAAAALVPVEQRSADGVAHLLSRAWEVPAPVLGRLIAALGPAGGGAQTAPRAADPEPRTAPADLLVGGSAAMRRVRAAVADLATVAGTVLLLGETGTGKDLAARELHRLGRPPGSPFVAVNCSSLPEGLIESLLFGHRGGAFTGATRDQAGLVEQAGDGTLFLDEIGTMPLALQAALLRLLEGGDYRPLGAQRPIQLRARVVAAANNDLPAAVGQGSFRADLYWRLERWVIRLPALREHREDLDDLYRAFAADAGASPIPEPPPEVWARWRQHPWPGNVRQFRNEVERLLAFRPLDGAATAEAASAITAAPAGGSAPAFLGPPAVARRRAAILALLDRHAAISRKTVIEACGCSPG